MPKIVACTLSSTIQKTILFPKLSLGEVNRSSAYRLDCSGKAVNAARVLNELERGSVVALCPVGEGNARLFHSLCEKDGLAVSTVEVPGLTRYCYTLLSPEGEGYRATELVVSEPLGDESLAVATGSASASYRAAAERLLGSLSGLLAGASGLILAGSRPLSFPADTYPRMCALARKVGAEVLVDYQGPDLLATLQGPLPTVIKINEEEFLATFTPLAHGEPYARGEPSAHGEPSARGNQLACGESGLDEDSLLRRIKAESERLGIAIVVTRGSESALAAYGGKGYSKKPPRVEAVNVIGCGDSFSAGFFREWLCSRDMDRALDEGNRCAALNARSVRPGSLIGGVGSLFPS